ncbi:hypothetical protein E3N88_23587 [Mikania micrantha]|uniref:Uncharacterized protein n=1 Tax=Mikania micrantha TaxID=192012 RepID=A0A5N6NDP0_9ASTR|nr:hypothetical protein E3N88_23587 [Mikania micrantha]
MMMTTTADLVFLVSLQQSLETTKVSVVKSPLGWRFGGSRAVSDGDGDSGGRHMLCRTTLGIGQQKLKTGRRGQKLQNQRDLVNSMFNTLGYVRDANTNTLVYSDLETGVRLSKRVCVCELTRKVFPHANI